MSKEMPTIQIDILLTIQIDVRIILVAFFVVDNTKLVSGKLA